MGKVKLEDAITGKKQISYTKKETLYASKCDCCGKVFEMEEYCNDKNLAYMRGTFDKVAFDSDGRRMGNMFSATICSFECAGKIFNGGWHKMKQYKPYKKEGAILARASLKITSYIKDEKEIIKKWKDKKENSPGTTGTFVLGSASYDDQRLLDAEKALHTSEALLSDLALDSNIPDDVVERLRLVTSSLSSFKE